MQTFQKASLFSEASDSCKMASNPNPHRRPESCRIQDDVARAAHYNITHRQQNRVDKRTSGYICVDALLCFTPINVPMVYMTLRPPPRYLDI